MVEALVVKDDMEILLLASKFDFLLGCDVLLNDRPLALLLFLDMCKASLSRLKLSTPLSDSLSFAIGLPPPALPDFRSGTIDMLPPGGLRERELGLVTIAPLSGVGTFLIESFGLPSI